MAGSLLEVSQVYLIGKNPVEQICERVLKTRDSRAKGALKGHCLVHPATFEGRQKKLWSLKVICLCHRPGRTDYIYIKYTF